MPSAAAKPSPRTLSPHSKARMISGEPIELRAEATAQEGVAPANPFTAADISTILRERGWSDRGATPGTHTSSRGDAPSAQLRAYPDEEWEAWLTDAAALLGFHAADSDALAELLSLIFQYDARAILQLPASHAILARQGAREVVRELAHLVLEGPEVDSNRFKEIVAALKDRLPFRGRELFHPIRLALAGRAGEGEFDRVILLLDRAARLPFHARVKGARQRMLEFCAALE